MANKTKLKLTTDLAGDHVIGTAVLSSWGLAIVYRVKHSLGLESEQQAYAQFPDGTAVPGWLGVDRTVKVRIGARLSSPPDIPVDPAPYIADDLAPADMLKAFDNWVDARNAAALTNDPPDDSDGGTIRRVPAWMCTVLHICPKHPAG